ncbi:hypothetical protein ACFY1L_32210 [Streptomyces sp. NPDC001663]|uniref:hypothetical protein n=1 Tax=Streptomyces sp. NPDC001663 TaxID=3364597 RepID=UPI003688D196
MDDDARSRPLSRRLMLRAAVAGTAAAAVVGGIVVATRPDGDTDTPRTTALSAAQLLHRAAERSRAESAGMPVPRNDQYVYTKTYTTRTYVNGSRTRTWSDESWLSVDGVRPSTEYAELGADKEAFMKACRFFVVPWVMPPGPEAAVFEAVARIPGMRVDHQAVDALGRRGVAVSYPKIGSALVFDPKTYAYLGMRSEGSTADWVGGEWDHHGGYHEVLALEGTGVVDRIGQRP